MGRGKKQARAGAPSAKTPKTPKTPKKAAKTAKTAAQTSIPSAPPQAIYPLPPWPRDQWASKRHATASPIRDEDALLGFTRVYGLERDFSNVADKGVTAIVSGNSFDNAMGTSLWGDDDNQEHTVYLLVDGQPMAEMNLANLCTWASKDHRGEGRKASHAATEDNGIVWQILDAEDLAAFADAEKLKRDWHEPDEEEVSARIHGHYLARGTDALTVDFCRTKWDDEQSEYVPDFAMAQAYLVDLMAWACGSKRPEVKLEAGPRLRPSALASRLG